jgi:hypothetical protein
VKKTRLTNSLLTALLLASPMAGAETQYPPAFEPTLIYQDAEYIASHPGPAIDPPKAAAPAPAAVEAAKPAPVAAPAAATAAKPASDRPVFASKDDSLSQNGPVFLVVAAMAGFVVWSGRSSKKCAGAAKAETGVAKYLKTIENETGVARYLRIRGMS